MTRRSLTYMVTPGDVASELSKDIKTFQAPERSGMPPMLHSGERGLPGKGDRIFPPAEAKHKPYPPSGVPPIRGSGEPGMSSMTPATDAAGGGGGAEIGNVAAFLSARAAKKSVDTGFGMLDKATKKPVIAKVPLPSLMMPSVFNPLHMLKDVLKPMKHGKKKGCDKKKKGKPKAIIHIKEVVQVISPKKGKHKKEPSVEKHLQDQGSVVLVKGQKYIPQGKLKAFGMPILIENKKGSVRSGKDSDGTPWKTLMRDHYGEFTGVPGVDGDNLDVFIGPELLKMQRTNGKEGLFDKVWVVHAKSKTTGRYDEDKVMFGYKTKEDAVRAFKQHYDQPEKFLGPINEYSISGFKEMIERLKGKRQGKRLGRGRYHK